MSARTLARTSARASYVLAALAVLAAPLAASHGLGGLLCLPVDLAASVAVLAASRGGAR